MIPPRHRAAPARSPLVLASVLVPRWAVAAALAACLAGCQLHIESAPTPPPSPSPAEVLRQGLALDAQRVAGLATCPDPGEHAELFAGIEQRANAQLQALGGVWRLNASAQPTPHGTPAQPAASPEVATPGAASQAASPGAAAPGAAASPEAAAPAEDGGTDLRLCDLSELGLALSETAATARNAAIESPDQDLFELAASISTARYLDAARVAKVDDAISTPKLPAAPLTDTNAPKLSGEPLATLVRNEDALGYAEESVAARLAGDEREQLFAEARAHRRAADSLALANGLTGKKDPRLAVYAVPAGGTSARQLQDFVNTQRAALPQAYFDALATASDPKARSALLSAFLGAQAQAERAGGTPPALPGLAGS